MRPTNRCPSTNGSAADAIIAAGGFRLWEAHLPPYAVQEEFVLIGAGVVFAVVAVGVRASRFATNLTIQLLLMLVSAVLTVLVLGVAGPWLGDDLPPLAAAAFATILLHFELGLRARHFALPLALSLAGLGSFGIYAVLGVTVSFGAIAIWTLVLLALGLLAFLTRRAVDRDLSVQFDRQASLLFAISDLGECLVITEDVRYVPSNDAYVNLTGYSREDLPAIPTLTALPPPEQPTTL